MFGMMHNPAQSYARIGVESAVETASPHKLILMLFDGAVAAISIAKIQIKANDIAGKGNSISRAIDLISNGLKVSLDLESGGDLATNLAALYDYMTERLLFANLKSNIAALEEVNDLLGGLRDAWAQIEQESRQAAA